LTTRIIVTETASVDQANILANLNEKAGLGVALKFRARFRALFDRLTDHPASGSRRPALGPNIRIGIVTLFIVIYRHVDTDDSVTVMRLIHSRRDITEALMTARD
jgi:toxin ParE1/3/4